MKTNLNTARYAYFWCWLLPALFFLPAVLTAQTLPGVGFQAISFNDPVSGGSMPGYVFYPSGESDSVTWIGPYALAAAAKLPALPGSKTLAASAD